jgi:Protein of unknown function (DUF2862)
MDIGQKVRVRRIRDRVSQEVAGKLGQFGTIVDLKVTDGMGIGVLVKFDDNYTTWFFDDEVETAA